MNRLVNIFMNGRACECHSKDLPHSSETLFVFSSYISASKSLLQCWSEMTLVSCCRYCEECICFEHKLRRGMLVDEC